MIKRTLLLIIVATVAAFAANAQYRLLYESFAVGSNGDTSRTLVTVAGDQLCIASADPEEANPIPGIAKHFTYIDYAHDTAFYQLYYTNKEQYFTGISLHTGNDYQFEKVETVNGYRCKKYTTSLFSNRMEIWMTEDFKYRATPTTTFADLPGVLVQYTRNGNATTRLVSEKIESSHRNMKGLSPIIPANLGQYTDRRAIGNLEKEKLVITIPVFKESQICFNPKLEKARTIPYDTVLPYSNGTIILKRMNLKQLPPHYQIFAELTEQSNGDAYDRTGSVFVIPASQKVSFLNALIDSVGVLPVFTDKNGAQYQGIKLEKDYTPLVELVRFFTPFGVHHFNQYRSLPDKEWEDAAYYKQDVSDLRQYLQGDVYIGAFIGNYDAGGHKITLDLKAYPESYEWTGNADEGYWTLPLFNTCNVMEMSGQNYGTLFGTDSLTVTFTVPEGLTSLRLRYLSTGHGGWDNGDEFVPKENVILIDGQPRFRHTPWRSDCGTFRVYNPASGNFWNGLSSSDYSRSGWCPGTATQPVYFDLTGLVPGQHTLTVAIPQGQREGTYFSAWNVSGILIGRK
ncbi:MAG: glpgli family protein [Bacteroidales bacterium]|nr:glpgli family protein [Bacteroidales bacterium]